MGGSGAERRVEEAHLVDLAVDIIGASAGKFAGTDDGCSGSLPAAAVGDGRLENAVDIEQEFAIRDVVYADQVVPDASRGGARRVGVDRRLRRCCRRRGA